MLVDHMRIFHFEILYQGIKSNVFVSYVTIITARIRP